jgi:apolipoprotein N-acyltransferase
LDWGRGQHEIHARVAPVRAAEYGLPIFRVASSGISQLVDRSGRRVDEAGFACRGATISGWLPSGKAGTLPLDRWLAPVAVGVSAGLILFLLVMAGRKRLPPTETM